MWVTLYGPWSTMRLRKKARVSSLKPWGGNVCNTGVVLQDLDLQLMLGAVCVYKWKDNMHMYSALLQCWKKCEAQILWLTGGALNLGSTHWSTKDNWMYFNKQDWSLKENHSRVEVLMENTRRPSSSLSSSLASPSSLTPSLPYCIWHNVLMLISTAQLGPAPGTNTV